MRHETKADIAALRSAVGQLKKAADAQEPPKHSPGAAQKQPPFPRFDSRIVSSFPPLLDEFRTKRFMLLWHGSRNGFSARDFHERCDAYICSRRSLWDSRIADNNIGLSDNYNANTRSRVHLSDAYTNDTGLGNSTVFTGSISFSVREIEVFGIID
jgi:hypothetical protein